MLIYEKNPGYLGKFSFTMKACINSYDFTYRQIEYGHTHSCIGKF